jgi:hypothetical protein
MVSYMGIVTLDLLKNTVFRNVTLVRIDVSEERIAFIIWMKRNSKLGTLAVTCNG